MAKSICSVVPGVQAENRPSPCSPPLIRPHAPEEVPESDEGRRAPPERPTEDFRPRPKGRGREPRGQQLEHVPGVQHEIRSRIRRQKQPSQQRPLSAKSSTFMSGR